MLHFNTFILQIFTYIDKKKKGVHLKTKKKKEFTYIDIKKSSSK